MGRGTVMRIGWVGGVLGVALFWCGHVSTQELGADAPEREGALDTEMHPAEDPKGTEDLPPEWVAEIMENREMFESLDLLDKFELFQGEDRFSPHRFE